MSCQQNHSSQHNPLLNYQVLAKFSSFLLPLFVQLDTSEQLKRLMTLVHGDAKLDNFMFRKVKQKLEETFTAIMIDWQGCGLDLVSNDLMWCLYGFVKENHQELMSFQVQKQINDSKS